MLNYLIEMLVCQILFLGLYQIFKSEPYFKINRFYLMFSLFLSLTLPLFSFTDVLPYQMSQTYVEWLQPLQIGGEETAQSTAFSETQTQASKGFQWNAYIIIYIVGLLLYLIWFFIRNRQLFKSLRLNSFEDYKFTPVVILPKTSMAFSFLDRLYIGEDIPDAQRELILEHEYQHLKKKHSWELLTIEIFQFILWFNPLVYLYKLQLRQLHEFEVDNSVVTVYSTTQYINTLLNQSFGSQNVSFIHTFSHTSQLKNRINMLRKTKTTTLRKLKYLLIIPVLALATLWSCTQDEYNEPELTEEKMNQQVIDFMNKFITQEPSIFKKIKEKPSLKNLFATYDLKIKDNYSEIEERKVGVVLSMVMVLIKNNQSYKNQILKEINNSKGLKIAFEKVQKRIEDRKEYREETQIEELDGDSSIPYALIDNPPHPQSCNGLTGDELKKCMSDFIGKHVNTTFKVPDVDLAPGRKRISVQFMIDKNGNIQNVRARGPAPELETEAIKAVQSLPQFVPGEVDGETVNVLYGLPINFVVPE